MNEKDLRSTLELHLDTLRRNLEVVSMEDLKTKYKKPYEKLRDNICQAATEYSRHVTLHGLLIKKVYFDEAQTYLREAIKQTTCLKKISEAAFQRQDIDEIERLAYVLRDEIQLALHHFYLNHMCLFISPECRDDPSRIPEIYNNASGCIWRNGTWVQMDDTGMGDLLSPEIITELPFIETSA